MSTRSTTHFVGHGGKLIARVYVHSDGYPEGVGNDIVRFLEDVARQTDDTRFSDPGYLAAKYVVWMGDYFRRIGAKYSGSGNLLDFISVGICPTDPDYDCGQEFEYTVDCDSHEEWAVTGREVRFPVVTCRLPGSSTEVKIPDLELRRRGVTSG